MNKHQREQMERMAVQRCNRIMMADKGLITSAYDLDKKNYLAGARMVFNKYVMPLVDAIEKHLPELEGKTTRGPIYKDLNQALKEWNGDE